MANRHEINLSLVKIEAVNHPVIADSQPVFVRTNQSKVR